MAGLISNLITTTITKTGGHLIRQSFKPGRRKRSPKKVSNQNQVVAGTESAEEISKEADYYLNWLENGIDDFVEKQAKQSLCSKYQLKYEYPELEYPFQLEIFPVKPNEADIIQIHPYREFLGRFLFPLRILNERALAKKKNIYRALMQDFKEKEDIVNAKREKYKTDYYSEKEKFDENFKIEVSQIEKIRNELKASQKTDYTPFIKLIINQTRITFGQIPVLNSLSYDQDDKSLAAEFLMPKPGQLPAVKSARYLKTYGGIRETEFTDPQLKRNYFKFLENIIFNVCYRLFRTDDLNALRKITLKFIAPDSHESYVEAVIEKPINIQEWVNNTSINIKSAFEVLKIRKREIGFDYF